ncbi:MAG TPA: hypothetical protein VJI46_05915 [Candidatus Nanoarchaeia archaeon]|nr:hypothetical protein [Candidatus Nanoarchaeia archaeon]
MGKKNNEYPPEYYRRGNRAFGSMLFEEVLESFEKLALYVEDKNLCLDSLLSTVEGARLGFERRTEVGKTLVQFLAEYVQGAKRNSDLKIEVQITHRDIGDKVREALGYCGVNVALGGKSALTESYLQKLGLS